MSNKLAKNTWPAGHSEASFKCSGPVATKDGEFKGTMLADLGCFNEQGKSSNKYYHCAVAQSTINSKWYAYFEYGKTGANTVGFQLIECDSKEEAQEEYEDQLHAKNDKRGVWEDNKILGKILKAKPGKDCYLVRPLNSRSVGLPDSHSISVVTVSNSVVVAPVSGKSLDKESASLIADLNITTADYTRSSLVGDCIPTKDAIEDGRKILKAATDLVNSKAKVKDLEELTAILYSKIPKKKNRGDAWVLSKDSIQTWSDDLDAFETAMLSTGSTPSKVIDNLPFFIEHIPIDSELWKFIMKWMPNATRNQHSYLPKGLKIHNLWRIEKDNLKLLRNKQREVIKTSKEEPLHQPSRIDLDKTEQESYNKSGTYLLFHGTRSVNVSGILRESLKLPAQLRGVATNGAMFGPGLYFADDWKKSAGYTSINNSYWTQGQGGINKRNSFMFLTDVVIGNPYVPPTSGDYKSKIDYKNYHSVYGKNGKSGVANNEFIVFDAHQHYLRYLVEFST